MADEKNLGAIMCPNCGRLISARAERCIYCDTRKPNLWGFSSVLRALFGGQTSLIPVIVTACVSLYVLSLLLDPSSISQSTGILGLLPPSFSVLKKLGMTGVLPITYGRWWTLITAIYLHGSLLHIVFNVLWIRQLGPQVEELYGISRSFLIFTIAGIVGFVVSSLAKHAYTLGASGSIFGLLGALVYYGRKRGGTFGAAILRHWGQWAAVLFILGFFVPIIDNYAHGGGFVGGYLAANALGFVELKRESRSNQMLALGALGLTVVAFLLCLLS
ncbi:MAG: rhomboid family intramembrane serine protease [bacterium]